MPTFAYTPMTDLTHAAGVVAMMASLYREDQPCAVIDPERFPVTVATLVSQPERGRILAITDGPVLCGYAILIPFWSNEFGGTVILVDEMYVASEYRGRGIGRAVLAGIEAERPYEAMAVLLEVSAGNVRARGLYESVGMKERHYATLAKQFGR